MTTWHVPADVLSRFATEPEDLDDVTAASVEQHLLACAACRAAVAGAASPDLVAASWDAVADAIDQPRTPPAERLLGRLGVTPALTRVVGATAGLRAAWGATVVALAAGAVLLGRDAGSDTPFLLVAPLVPLVAVLITFLPPADPAGEVGTATPLHGAGLALRRTVAVLVPTLAVLGGAALIAPEAAGGAAWVLPGLALAAASLALSTVMRASLAAGGLAVAWTMTITAVRTAGHWGVPLGDTPLFGPAGQLASLAVALLAGAWIVVRRDRFSTMEVSW